MLPYLAVIPGGILLGVVGAAALNWVQIVGMLIGASLFYLAGVLAGRGH